MTASSARASSRSRRPYRWRRRTLTDGKSFAVTFEIDADDFAVTDDDVLVEDRSPYDGTLADAHTRHQHAALDGRTVLDHHVGTEYRIAHGRRGQDRPSTDHRFLRESALHELCGREILGGAADGPATVVEIEDRVHRHQVHVSVVEGVEVPTSRQ